MPSPSREACRTTSWLDSTQVVGAPTESVASSERVITAYWAGAVQAAIRYSKLNAWCISSGRTYRASRSAGSTHASATRIRSPGYESSTRRHSR